MQFGDFLNFNKFLAPVLIKFVYWAGLLVIGIFVLSSIAGMSFVGRYGGDVGVGTILMVLLLGGLSAVLWRVSCEIWIVIFSINDRLGIIAGQTEKSATE